MEEGRVFDTLLYETAGNALGDILPLIPFRQSVADNLRLLAVLVATLAAYRDRGLPSDLDLDYAVAATEHLAEALPLRPPDRARDKMKSVCVTMIASYRHGMLNRRRAFLECVRWL
jgi:hypothetical protein